MWGSRTGLWGVGLGQEDCPVQSSICGAKISPVRVERRVETAQLSPEARVSGWAFPAMGLCGNVCRHSQDQVNLH